MNKVLSTAKSLAALFVAPAATDAFSSLAVAASPLSELELLRGGQTSAGILYSKVAGAYYS